MTIRPSPATCEPTPNPPACFPSSTVLPHLSFNPSFLCLHSAQHLLLSQVITIVIWRKDLKLFMGTRSGGQTKERGADLPGLCVVPLGTQGRQSRHHPDSKYCSHTGETKSTSLPHPSPQIAMKIKWSNSSYKNKQWLLRLIEWLHIPTSECF